MLERQQLLPLARSCADRAVEPRIRRRFRCGHDAEGSETGPGRRRQGRRHDAVGRPGRALYALFNGLGYGGKDFSAMVQMLRGRIDTLAQ